MEIEVIKNRERDNGFKILIGGLFMIFGLFTLGNYIGYLFIIISLSTLFYSSGIEFDLKHKKVRAFYKYFKFYNGAWIGLEHFHAISIKKVRKGLRRYGGNTHISISTFYSYYEVILMSKNGEERILLFSSKIKIHAEEFAMKWSEKLELPIKSYGQK